MQSGQAPSAVLPGKEQKCLQGLVAHFALPLLLLRETLSDSLGTGGGSQPPALRVAFTLAISVLGNLSKTGVCLSKTELGMQGRALSCCNAKGCPGRVVQPHPYTLQHQKGHLPAMQTCSGHQWELPQPRPRLSDQEFPHNVPSSALPSSPLPTPSPHSWLCPSHVAKCRSAVRWMFWYFNKLG